MKITPKRENVEFYARPYDALYAGFRPCLRCRPLEARGRPPAVVEKLLSAVEAGPGERLREADELVDKLRLLDSDERDDHEKRWKVRERLHTRIKASMGDIDTQVSAIMEREHEGEAPLLTVVSA